MNSTISSITGEKRMIATKETTTSITRFAARCQAAPGDVVNNNASRPANRPVTAFAVFV